MSRFLLTFSLLLFSIGNSNASVTYWYNTVAEVSAAFSSCYGCPGGSTSGGYSSYTNTAICSGTGAVTRQYKSGNWPAVGNTVFWSACTSGYKACSVSGQIRDSSSNCVCPSGQVVINNACAAPVVQDCPATQYRDLSYNCVAAPDCNIGHPEGGYYFAAAIRQCTSAVFDGTVLACANSARPVACPPYNDCLASGVVCSDNTADAQKFLDDKAALTPAAKAAAVAAVAAAEASKNDATAAAGAKAAAAATALQNSAAAQAAAASGTPESINAAAAAAIEAAAAATKAANAAQQKTKSIGFASEASNQNNLIPTDNDYPPGRAQNASDRAQIAANNASKAYLDAVLGVGDTSGLPQDNNFDCPDCAKETTLESFKAGTANTLDKSANEKGFDTDIESADSDITAAKTAYTTKLNDIKTSLNTIIGIDTPGVSELPVFDFGTIKGTDVVVDFSKWPQLSFVGLMILFFAGFIAIRIILE